jgi:hypothetical protein
MNYVGVWLIGLAATGLVACGDDGDCCAVMEDGGLPEGWAEIGQFPGTVNRDVDVLFVIDDSPSMLDKQSNLRASFPVFVNLLDTVVDGFPNLHLGVVTTDLGTTGADDAAPAPGIGSGPGACSGSGKAGALQTNGAPVTGGPFIRDLQNTDGTRTTNYTGTLPDVFSALTFVGASGCGYEQPIEAARRALDNHPNNAGFLRPNARLAIVVLSDEDDCSVARTALFGPDTATLGPLQSFRCTRFGVTCDGGGATSDAMNEVGVKTACRSNEQSAYLTDLGRYVTFFRGLKADPRDVMFNGIAGKPAPFEVELRSPPGGGNTIPALVHSCQYLGASGNEFADPAVRLAELATRLNGAFTSVCSDDLTQAMLIAAQQVKNLIGDGCVTRPIAAPPMCRAFDLPPGGGETEVPVCTGAIVDNCFTLTLDANACPAAPHFRFAVERAGAPPAGTWTSLRCAL